MEVMFPTRFPITGLDLVVNLGIIVTFALLFYMSIKIFKL